MSSTEDVTTIHLSGELDMGSAPQLAACMQAVLATRPDRVVVDCADLTFMDSAGIAVLVTAWNNTDGRTALRNLRPIVRRVIAVTGLDDLVDE
ncbi:MAG TPA: STAS domain-containing protein [Aquihabitans sp.]|nr:STAS domain-containing protein [Aquihabitans sp.]